MAGKNGGFWGALILATTLGIGGVIGYKIANEPTKPVEVVEVSFKKEQKDVQTETIKIAASLLEKLDGDTPSSCWCLSPDNKSLIQCDYTTPVCDETVVKNCSERYNGARCYCGHAIIVGQ